MNCPQLIQLSLLPSNSISLMLMQDPQFLRTQQETRLQKTELKYSFWVDCNSTDDTMNFMSGCVFFLPTCPQDKTIDGIQTDVLFLIGVDTHLECLPFLQLACV